MPSILQKIDNPAQLRGLSHRQLVLLAEEIRAELVERVPENGGHLASNLGVVELTIALHRVCQTPRDKIVWDVSHQCYVHKLLTGRREQFGSIRQHGGLSGFTDPLESPHDAFGAGHACTALSAALGIATARDLAGESHHVVAVVGDGAFSGGMTFEALNHAGHLGTRLIVILNDNGMSISPSVGGLSRWLNAVRLDARYEFAKDETRRAVTLLPGGDAAWSISKRLKGRLKRALIPSSLWEELGFTYLGPVDGHDLRELEAALLRARDHEAGPTLIHVLTRKGKGYGPAEADATKFHGVSPRGGKSGSSPSYSEVFGRTTYRLMREDNRVVAITAAMIDGTGLTLPAAKFPHRVFDVGICEEHAVTLAAGMATRGIVPIVAIYSTFLQRAYDQIIHDVCIRNYPVVFALDRSEIVGDDGKTHNGVFDISFLSGVPNMVVAAPRDENELQNLLYTAVNAGRPMAVRYPRGRGPGAPLQHILREIPIGRGEILREGGDVALVAFGSMVSPALSAADTLAAQGIECAVANARFAKPLDAEMILELARRTGRVVTLEEGALAGGFGSAVLQLVARAGLEGVRVQSLGLPDRFIEHGPRDLLLRLSGLDVEGIARSVRAAFPGVGRPSFHEATGRNRRMTLPSCFDRYRTEVDAELRASLAAYPSPMYDMLRYHMGWIDERGAPLDGCAGKALRPTLCLLACESVSGRHHQALPAAAAIELIHNFSLIHDDIQDNDLERRHRPTVWSLWGKPQAINAGTAMRVVASLTMLGLEERGVPVQRLLRAQRLLDESCLRLIEGQYLDISFENRLDVGVDDYLAMIQGKTARLISTALEIGTLLGSEDEGLIRTFRQFGLNLGLAFQVRDDVLGIWGTEEKTGKPVGSDIWRRKKSLPIVYAFGRAAGPLGDDLVEIYRADMIDAGGVDRVLSILEEVDARAAAQEMAEGYCSRALAELSSAGLSSWATNALREMALFLTERDF